MDKQCRAAHSLGRHRAAAAPAVPALLVFLKHAVFEIRKMWARDSAGRREGPQKFVVADGSDGQKRAVADLGQAVVSTLVVSGGAGPFVTSDFLHEAGAFVLVLFLLFMD